MTNRLKLIILVGVGLIAATYVMTRTPDDSASADAAYQQNLEEIRQKRAVKLAQSKKAESASSPLAQSRAYSEQAQTQKQVSLPEHVSQSFQNVLQSLSKIVPSDSSSQPPVIDEKATRLQYLQTIPIGMIEATHRPEAVAMARQDAGRIDPFAPLVQSHPFPKPRKGSSSRSDDDLERLAGAKLPGPHMGSGPEGLPPPPPGEMASADDLSLPPDPSGIEHHEFPSPPPRQFLSEHLKLNAIVGDRVILAFKDKEFRRQNGFKKYITLAEGQDFDTITLVDVEKDKAVLEENGEQRVIQLDPIR